MEKFSDLSLSTEVLESLAEMGLETPTPIQAGTLPVLLGEPTDFLGMAATGTGKTAAFAIPLVEKLDPTRRGIQALVLCPTRELAIQVAGQISLIGKKKGIEALPIYGGSGYSDQIHNLKKGFPVVVGTPGRVLDHMERKTLLLEGIGTLILDEADEMISMGFQRDLERILSEVPEGQAKTWLFAATMDDQVRKVADRYLKNPGQVRVNRSEMLSGTVEQIYYATQEANKPEVLCKLIDAATEFYGIVFCQTKALVADLTQYLVQRGYHADCLHGDMDQASRGRTLRKFREKRSTILIATDVACRGLDVKDITHVINYSIPRELENYIHRIGRTGRGGKTGFALSLVTPSHRGLIGQIERMTKTKMKEGQIPTRKELGEKKIAGILTAFQSQAGHAKAVELLGEDWKSAIATMEKEEIAGRFLSLLHPELFGEREQAREIRAARIVPAEAPPKVRIPSMRPSIRTPIRPSAPSARPPRMDRPLALPTARKTPVAARPAPAVPVTAVGVRPAAGAAMIKRPPRVAPLATPTQGRPYAARPYGKKPFAKPFVRKLAGAVKDGRPRPVAGRPAGARPTRPGFKPFPPAAGFRKAGRDAR